MKINNVIWRVVSITILLAVGIWGFLGNSGPAAETAARERAVLSLSEAQQNVGNGEPGSFTVEAQPVSTSIDAAVETMKTFQPAPSQYERWLAGEIDLDEMEYRVGPATRQQLIEEAKKRSENTPFDGRIVEIAELDAPNPNALTLGASFAALDVADCCGGSTSVPPDSDMAAGLTQLIAVENSSFEIYDKSGTSLAGPVLFDAFLTSLGASGTFDPTVLYDQEEDRFVMGIEDGEFFYLMVSATSNALGGWYVYEFDAQFYGDEFFDYPHIGIGDHAIFMGANMFGGSVPGGYEGRIYAMEKDDAYAGLAVTMVSRSTTADGGTPQPLNLTGWAQDAVPVPFNSHYFVTDYYDGGTVWLWRWNNPFGGGIPSVVQVYNFGADGFPLEVEQLGGGNLEGNDWRLRSFEYRNGYAWITDTVSFDSGSGLRNWARVNRISLDTAGYPDSDGNWWGTTLFGSTGRHLTFPDMTANMCDDFMVGHTYSGSSDYAGARILGMTYPYTTYSAMIVKAGEATYTAFDGAPYRWGDYSGVAIDPDGKTFWFMGEYAKTIGGYAANYGNWIASATHPDCVARSFRDVPVDAFAWSQIESIYEAGITGGCSTGPRNYCPNSTVTRAQMAIFLLRGINGSGYTPPAATGTMFNDVSSGSFAAAWIEALANAGITSGCGGGNFCPNATVSRAQMAVFLLRAKYGSGYTPPAATGTAFTDVPLGSFAAAWIEQLASESISTGCGGGNFCPNQNVSRAQMAVFLQRTFGLTLP